MLTKELLLSKGFEFKGCNKGLYYKEFSEEESKRLAKILDIDIDEEFESYDDVYYHKVFYLRCEDDFTDIIISLDGCDSWDLTLDELETIVNQIN